MDILKMAAELANNMSNDDKNSLENMDMEKMITHVTQNVFKMMGNNSQPTNFDNLGNFGNSNLGNFDNLFKTSVPPPTEQLQKTRDICFELNVDLEDFYTGKKKKMNIKRKRIIEVNGVQKIIEEKKKIIIPIEKGMKDEQQIRFEGEADQIPGYRSGDIVVTLIENEHPVFQRDGDNLIIIKNISLYQNYNISFDIKHLDSRILRIKKDDYEALHLNEGLRKITSEGMPIYRSSDTGDLFIRFNLVIPKSLDNTKLKQISGIFDHADFENKLEDTFTKTCILENVSDTDFEESENSDDYSDESSELSELSLSEPSSSDEEPIPRKKVFPKIR